MHDSFQKVVKRYFNVCKKSGKIISVNFKKKKNLLILPILGILALAWFLIRTIPKPSRAAYPCQRVAAGIGVTFLTFIAGALGSLAFFKVIKRFMKKLPAAALIICTILCISAGLLTSTLINSFISEDRIVYADWNPGDPPNSPMGTAKGINPGRVAWAHNPDATANTPSGSWYQPGNTNQEVVNQMFSDLVNTLTGETNNPSAWDALFRYFNQNHGKGNVGYSPGETIVVKINTVNTSSQSKWGSNIDATAETVLGVVEQLVAQAGIPQNNIIIYDGGVGTIGSYVYNCVHNVYPNVPFQATSGWGSIATVQWVDNGITYSNGATTSAQSRRVVKCLWDADYLINLALLKKHEDQTAVTLCGKNHFGSIQNCRDIHSTINDHINGMGSYNSLVDLLGHKEIGGKTLLFIIDGLWGAPSIMGQPTRWNLAPFNNDWPSSIFISQDGVAIDSVGLDFINGEWTLWDNADNYLHEAARANNPPSGIYYDPENDGTRLESLGAHEHWNNTQSKQYSRNLGTGNGIELVSAASDPTATTPPTVTPPTATTPPTVTIPPIMTAAPTIPPMMGNLGDVNNDGAIDIIDALLIAQYYVGLNPQNFNINNSDTNCDTRTDIIDGLLVSQFYVGLISIFC
ncbi:MAG: DUF362 domain-containing protein [Spirochaetales bacterium]|nr:DUF362 domain-containing protein [Spirochaetales bacterium]